MNSLKAALISLSPLPPLLLRINASVALGVTAFRSSFLGARSVLNSERIRASAFNSSVLRQKRGFIILSGRRDYY